MDTLIWMLRRTGYLHNHARMYLASYVVHFRKVAWRSGADWMYGLLIDGDFSSNHLSWQWVASTFSHKPYIFNRENLERYAGSVVPGDPLSNDPFNYSYEELAEQLLQVLIPRNLLGDRPASINSSISTVRIFTSCFYACSSLV
ncbi:MAG: hypothetical protein HC772_05710 [Leptolyngbyaceae cyanobacterium CRU_2_3]|nr:hypothetical protein [Leptolyngbyaceae cyanobacterium CRU_2_3]